jgi:hypothetical protein
VPPQALPCELRPVNIAKPGLRYIKRPSANTGQPNMPVFRIRRHILVFDNKKWNFAFTFVMAVRHVGCPETVRGNGSKDYGQDT